MNRKSWLLLLSGLIGFLGVLLGATGKHALKEEVESKLYQNFETGLKYHQVHGVALLAIALGSLVVPGKTRASRLQASGWLMFAGLILFSGSLYLLAFTGSEIFGRVTPFGGTLIMASWLVLSWAAATPDQTS